MRVNLASGQRPFKGDWVNVDIREQLDDKGNKYPVDVLADIKKLPFDDNSCDILIAHHCLEHIRLNDLGSTIKEWYRVLKPKGKLVVFVPNLRVLAEAWLNHKIDNFIFLVNVYGAYQGFEEDTHKWGYDENELDIRLSCNNFIQWSSVKQLSPDDIKLDFLYSGADIAFDWWILSREYTK